MNKTVRAEIFLKNNETETLHFNSTLNDESQCKAIAKFLAEKNISYDQIETIEPNRNHYYRLSKYMVN